jgi:hypothetical protein
MSARMTAHLVFPMEGFSRWPKPVTFSVVEGERETAGPSAPLRSGRDDKGGAVTFIRSRQIGWTKKGTAVTKFGLLHTSNPG